MSFTARHYNSIQRIIREHRAAVSNVDACGTLPGEILLRVQDDLGRMLAADNPRFDLTRYAIECTPKEQTK